MKFAKQPEHVLGRCAAKTLAAAFHWREAMQYILVESENCYVLLATLILPAFVVSGQRWSTMPTKTSAERCKRSVTCPTVSEHKVDARRTYSPAARCPRTIESARLEQFRAGLLLKVLERCDAQGIARSSSKFWSAATLKDRQQRPSARTQFGRWLSLRHIPT